MHLPRFAPSRDGNLNFPRSFAVFERCEPDLSVSIWTDAKSRIEFLLVGKNGNVQKTTHFADIAQLVERNLAKVEVASSNLVVRSQKDSPTR